MLYILNISKNIKLSVLKIFSKTSFSIFLTFQYLKLTITNSYCCLLIKLTLS